MRILLTLLAITFSSAAFAGPIYTKKFNDSDDEKVDAHVLETIKEALNGTAKNQLKDTYEKIRKDLEGSGTVSEPSQGDMLQIYHGKGGSSQFGGEYLVGFPVSMQGSGMIEEFGGYFKVRYSLDMAKGELTVIIENIVKLVDQK